MNREAVFFQRATAKRRHHSEKAGSRMTIQAFSIAP